MAHTLSKKDFDKIYVLYQHVSSTHAHYGNMTQNQLDCAARMIGNTIHDLTKVWSGYISYFGLEYIIKHNKPFASLASDHYNSRLQSGKQIISLFKKFGNIPFDSFYNLIFESCFVHKILQSENNKLIKHQSKGLHWSQCYIDCGVDLIFLGDEKGNIPSRVTRDYLKNFEWLIKKEEN